MDWLHRTITSLAERTGLDASGLDPSPAVRRALLDVARIAAHTSGERTNAPLLCYVLGRAVEGGADLDTLVEAVKEVARADEA